MRIRITYKTQINEAWLFPGDVIELDDKTAEALIEKDKAIHYPDDMFIPLQVVETAETPKKKRTVKHGDG